MEGTQHDLDLIGSFAYIPALWLYANFPHGANGWLVLLPLVINQFAGTVSIPNCNAIIAYDIEYC